MRMVQRAANRLARRAIVAGAAAGVFAAMVAGPAPNAGDAHARELPIAAKAAAPQAAEIFVCVDATPDRGRFPLELWLKDGILSEQPLGTPRYALLANTPYAVIGEDHFGDFDSVLGTVSVFIATIVIDRTSGSFTTTMTSAGGAPLVRTGRCRKFEERVAPVSDGALARR